MFLETNNQNRLQLQLAWKGQRCVLSFYTLVIHTEVQWHFSDEELVIGERPTDDRKGLEFMFCYVRLHIFYFLQTKCAYDSLMTTAAGCSLLGDKENSYRLARVFQVLFCGAPSDKNDRSNRLCSISKTFLLRSSYFISISNNILLTLHESKRTEKLIND